MIDADGFRSNVGIILSNSQGAVMWARRYGQDSWQFPQGGMQSGETPEQSMFRELEEEVGLTENDVNILGCSKGWLRYRLPKRLIRRDSKPLCVGQKQKWFLLQLASDEDRVCLDTTNHPEFDGWKWVSYWYPLREVVSFKRDVYRRALGELAPLVFHLQHDPSVGKSSGNSRRNNRKRQSR